MTLQRLVCNRFDRVIFNFQVYAVQFKEFLILFDQRILWLVHNPDQCVLSQLIQSDDDRQTSDKLRNQTELQQILRLYITLEILFLFLGKRYFRIESDDILL